MKLNSEKILKLKKLHGLTYQQIANRMGLKHRQHVFDYIKNKRLSGAEKFAKVFGIDPKDLII